MLVFRKFCVRTKWRALKAFSTSSPALLDYNFSRNGIASLLIQYSGS